MILSYPPNYHQFGIGLGITVLTYPLTNAKILIQLGNEPLSPYLTKDIFGRSVGCYPNVFRYIGHIKKAAGFAAIYKGLSAKICESVVSAMVSVHVSQKLKELYPGPTLYEIIATSGKRRPDAEELLYSAGGGTPYVVKAKDGSIIETGLMNDHGDSSSVDNMLWESFYIEMARESLCHAAAIVASQPFHVIMVRMIAEFIGKETKYSNIFSSISEIYNTNGIPGFFSGLAPRMLCELFTFWIANTLAYFANKYLLESTDLQTHTLTVTGIIANMFTYPYSLVGNVMCVTGSGLVAGQRPHMLYYKSWFDCWNHLSSQFISFNGDKRTCLLDVNFENNILLKSNKHLLPDDFYEL